MSVVVSVRKARLGAKAQVVLPKEARQAVGLRPGDSFAFIIDGSEVRVVRVPTEGDDPFAFFSAWASEADRKGYGDLSSVRRRVGAVPVYRPPHQAPPPGACRVCPGLPAEDWFDVGRQDPDL